MAIYRYKFNNNLLQDIIEFSSVHRYDDPETFREAWDEWIKDNTETISREQERLRNIGYMGDVKVKMYKSARYYFKNKPLNKTLDNSLNKSHTVKRRKYISISKNFIAKIDEHIDNNGLTVKPSVGYLDFIETNKSLISEEKTNLDSKIPQEDIEAKIKKTYKNRHFLKSSKSRN